MSLYYEKQNRKAAACDFGGNAHLNSGALTTNAADSAASCITNPGATFVPGPASSTSGEQMGISVSIQSLGLVMCISTIGALWTLLA